jgi:hypothetical protein
MLAKTQLNLSLRYCQNHVFANVRCEHAFVEFLAPPQNLVLGFGRDKNVREKKFASTQQRRRRKICFVPVDGVEHAWRSHAGPGGKRGRTQGPPVQ